MPKEQLNLRVSDLTLYQLKKLVEWWGTSQTETVTVVFDRIYNQERKMRMIITVATKDKVNEASRKYTVNGATETDSLTFGIKDGDEIYVTEIGSAGQGDVEDEKTIANLNPIYWSYSIEQVANQLRLTR